MVSAWDDPLVSCEECKTEGCTFNATFDGYCCLPCQGATTQPGTWGSGRPLSDGHEPGCSRLQRELLERSWWEYYRCDLNYDEDATCLVVPPSGEVAGTHPAPVILFLTGNGHVNDKENFFDRGVDVLLKNEVVRQSCYVVAPRPTTASGLIRNPWDYWNRSWSEAAVWELFTEVLRRLGPHKADASRLYCTGFSLGASGVWNLACYYGHFFAAVTPISGMCGWPPGTWTRGTYPRTEVLDRLESLPLRACQCEVDNAGQPTEDMEWLRWDYKETTTNMELPGMEIDTTLKVKVRKWDRPGKASWELWLAEGPMKDWSAWDEWGGDKHCLWNRIYPSPAWGLMDFFLAHRVPPERCWSFDTLPKPIPLQPPAIDHDMGANAESTPAEDGMQMDSTSQGDTADAESKQTCNAGDAIPRQADAEGNQACSVPELAAGASNAGHGE